MQMVFGGVVKNVHLHTARWRQLVDHCVAINLVRMTKRLVLFQTDAGVTFDASTLREQPRSVAIVEVLGAHVVSKVRWLNEQLILAV